jgi:hypothetical protein
VTNAENTAAAGPSPTKAHDSRTMIGHVVVCHGRDENDQDAVAVWHVDATGNNTGAWILEIDLTEPAADSARRILELCLRRAVVAWNPTETLSILARLAKAAEVTMPSWTDTAIALPEAVGHVVTTRLAYEKHTNDVSVGKQVAPIEWPVDLPEHIPSTFDGMWQAVHLVLPSTNPVAEQALMTCALVRWTVQRWQETMTTLSRRRHLQDAFGRPRVLPPAWESRLADAYERHRALG